MIHHGDKETQRAIEVHLALGTLSLRREAMGRYWVIWSN